MTGKASGQALSSGEEAAALAAPPTAGKQRALDWRVLLGFLLPILLAIALAITGILVTHRRQADGNVVQDLGQDPAQADHDSGTEVSVPSHPDDEPDLADVADVRQRPERSQLRAE